MQWLETGRLWTGLAWHDHTFLGGLKATAAGKRKLAQNMRLFGATSRTSQIATSGSSGRISWPRWTEIS